MIRVATLDDIEWLADITCKDMFALLGNTDLYDPNYLKTTLLPAVISSGISVVDEGKGALLGIITSNPFNPNFIVATELAWWVSKELRSSPLGYRLMREFEKKAKEKNATSIVLSLMESSPLKSLDKVGYTKKETAWLKEI